MDERGGIAERLGTVAAAEGVVAHVVDGEAVLGPATSGGDGLLRGVLVHDDDRVMMYTVDADSLLGPVNGATGPEDALDSADADRPPSVGSFASSSDAARTSDVGTVGDPGSQLELEVDSAARLNLDVRDDARHHRLPEAEDDLPGDRPAHWPRPGPGRPRGSALDMRASLKDVLVIIFCRQAAAALALHDGPTEAAESDLDGKVEALDNLRRTRGYIRDDVLASKAWSLRRSGSVGALIKFKDNGARDHQTRDANLAIEVTLSTTGDLVVCCSRTAEDCLAAAGCALRQVVSEALTEVRTAASMSLPELVNTLSDDLRVSSMQEGAAVLYGKTLCVVRRAGASWPFAVVRRKPNGTWQCHACQVGAGTCTHARAAAEAVVDEQSDASDTDDGEDVRGGPRGRRSPVFTKRPRPLVPTDRSQAHHAAIIRAAAAGTTITLRETPASCPRCGQEKSPFCRAGRHEGVIEFGGGAVKSSVPYWWCGSCRKACVTDGLEDGLVVTSLYTAFTEVFLFETCVNLCRNGSSITATFDLRAAFHQLSKRHSYPRSLDELRTLPGFRGAILRYIYLVIIGLPKAVSTCATCMRSDGSILYLCFDGLQLGFKIRFRTPFHRVVVNLRPVLRASIMCNLITDSALARVLGSVFSVARTDHETVVASTVKTLTAVRAHVMAISVLIGYLQIDGVVHRFSGPTAHFEGRSANRGWDPVVDGGADVALVDFVRVVFRCGRAARKLALTLAGASATLRAKVPPQLMQRAVNIIEHGAPDSGSDTDSEDEEHDDAARAEAVDRRVHRQDLAEHARDVADLVLGDTGGAAGDRMRKAALLRIRRRIPHTVGTAERLTDFLRAVTVDPVVVWAPKKDWTAVSSLVDALRTEPFSAARFRDSLRSEPVKELRLLHGAAVALYPSLCSRRAPGPQVREVFLNLLLSLFTTARRYDEYIAEDERASLPVDDSGQIVHATREDMAAAPATATFHVAEYHKAWLESASTPEQFKSVYGSRADKCDDFLASGQWAPSFPSVRPLPGFLAAAADIDDRPGCNHKMGVENQFTGGTFAGSCTCEHPKTVAVVVLEGSEGQRMPAEFIAQRMPHPPDRIFYDFSCASLKTSLCRLPLLAVFVSWLVDRFHWLMNHISCSKAMNPDSYKSVDAQNTSASEERNAASRRLQNFLRLCNQQNFILFTIYQHAVGNVIAMHKDAKLPTGAGFERWPAWYKRTFVVPAERERGIGVARARAAAAAGERVRAAALAAGASAEAAAAAGREAEAGAATAAAVAAADAAVAGSRAAEAAEAAAAAAAREAAPVRAERLAREVDGAPQ